MSLVFQPAKKEKEIKEVYEYTIDAFSDTPDFNWTLDEIKKEMGEGWLLFGVRNMEQEIVAACFYKKEGDSLLTKNTGLKINHQGSGYSHAIKEFFEREAKKLGCTRLIHYCRIDNFRTYSLNESHGYKKTGNSFQSGQVVEWAKAI